MNPPLPGVPQHTMIIGSIVRVARMLSIPLKASYYAISFPTLDYFRNRTITGGRRGTTDWNDMHEIQASSLA